MFCGTSDATVLRLNAIRFAMVLLSQVLTPSAIVCFLIARLHATDMYNDTGIAHRFACLHSYYRTTRTPVLECIYV